MFQGKESLKIISANLIYWTIYYAPYASKLLLVCTFVFLDFAFSFLLIAIEFSMNKVDYN